VSREKQVEYMATALRALGIGSVSEITRAEIVMDGQEGLQVTLHISPKPSTQFDALRDLPTISMRLVPEH
jgi:hypothetical protein